MLIDTHCHIHDSDYPIEWNDLLSNAKNNGVEKFICIGTDVENSKEAIIFANSHDEAFASIGVHPNNCQSGIDGLESLLQDKNSKIVAIGEIGLDYHYELEDRELQIDLLKKQLELAIRYNLPIVFHVREAYDDFWPIIDEVKRSGHKIKGVLHSFTDNPINLKRAIEEGLLIGVNGFSTFTKDDTLKNMYRKLSLSNIVLETNAPYLTPKGFRGKINEPAYVRVIAEFVASIREIPVEDVEKLTTTNAQNLFNI